MEALIRKAFGEYLRYVSEANLYEQWLEKQENPDVRNTLGVLQMKIAAIDSWLNLLNADERFVVQKHLIEELEWPRVAFDFTERWKGEFTRTERTLVKYQASAIRKIADFCMAHSDITLALFGRLLEGSSTSSD